MTGKVRRAILRQLVAGDSGRFGRPYLPAAVRREAGCSETEVWEVLWSLVADGLLYLDTAGQGSGTDNWQWRLSADGRRIAEGGTWEPRDPDGYLDRVRREISELDELVELYLTEALQSFNARSYLATSVMLGVAAERAFLVMATAFAASTIPGVPAMAKDIDRPRSNYFALWVEFRVRIEPARGGLPDGLADPLTLDAILRLRFERGAVLPSTRAAASEFHTTSTGVAMFAEAASQDGLIVILTGPPGAGKTTVGRALARCYERSVHLHTDDFWHAIASGGVPPYLPEADGQNQVVVSATAAAAFVYARGGYVVIVDGIVGPWMLPHYISQLDVGEAVPVHYLVLRPARETTLARAQGRTDDGALVDAAPILAMWDQFAELGAMEGHAMDTSTLDPRETLAAASRAIAAGSMRL